MPREGWSAVALVCAGLCISAACMAPPCPPPATQAVAQPASAPPAGYSSSAASVEAYRQSARLEPMACPPVTRGALTNFTTPSGFSNSVIFGDSRTTLSGGIFAYPTNGSSYPVRSDLAEGDWHLTGMIGEYSGFGVFWHLCHKVDASAYRGVSFSVRGKVARDGVITLSINTAANEISPEWLTSRGEEPLQPSFGRCIPAQSQYDGSCLAAMARVPVTDEAVVHEVLWEQLSGGKPEPGVNPAEITGLLWMFPPPTGVSSALVQPYDVDIRLDDLAFIPR